MSRVACALGTIKTVLDRYEENHVAKTSSTHQEAKNLEDLKAIIHCLIDQDVFEKHTKRSYKAFPKPRDPLHAKSFENITQWIKDHIDSYFTK